MQANFYSLIDEFTKLAAPTLTQKLDKHFSSDEKNWDEFKKNINNPRFRNLVVKHPQADEKLKLFVQALGKHNSAQGKAIEVVGSTGKKYIVKNYKDGSQTCSCEDFIYRGAPYNKTCKHIQGIAKTAGFVSEILKESTNKKFFEKIASAYVPKWQQEKSYSCSAACLKSVLNYYGKEITEKECIKIIGTKPNKGAETDQITKAAKELGFKAYDRSLSMKETKRLLDNGIPIICDIQSFTKKGSGHYVVLIDMDDTHVELMDPNVEGNFRRLSIKEFEDRWWDRAMASPHEMMIRWGIVITKA